MKEWNNLTIDCDINDTLYHMNEANYPLKKIMKLAFIGLGLLALLLGYLSYQKWILVSWATVENQSSTMMEHAAHKVYVVTQQMEHSIPIGAGLIGFIPGVFLGFLKG